MVLAASDGPTNEEPGVRALEGRVEKPGTTTLGRAHPSPMGRRHLRYPSVEAWLKGEGLPSSFLDIADPREFDRRITEYGELRRRLFARHLKTLSRQERLQVTRGDHPAQSHRFADRARPFAARLQAHLAGLGFRAEVEIGYGQMDRIVLSATLPADPGPDRNRLPGLFRGFEVLYNWSGAATGTAGG